MIANTPAGCWTEVAQIELSADETAALADPLSNAEELRSQLAGG